MRASYTADARKGLRLSEICTLKLRLSIIMVSENNGPYIEELNDGMNLRGSSNQRAIALTARYESDVDGYGSKKAEVEFFMKEDKVLMVGVPDSNTLNRFKYAFKEETIDE